MAAKKVQRILVWLSVLVPLWWRQPNRLQRLGAAISQDLNTIIKGIMRGIFWLFGKQPPSWAAEPQQNKADELQDQVASTYSNLRYGLAVISFVLPLFLLIIGKYWYGIPWQNSMSAYYWAGSNVEGPIRSWLTGIGFLKYFLVVLAGLDGDAPMRSWFVGTLFVLGIFLYLYKGFSWQENVYLNVAGLSTLGVALFPMEWNCGASCRPWTFHGIFAIVAFVFIALVALLCANDTLRKLPLADPTKTNAYRWWYFWLGVAMLLFPFVAWGITTWLPEANDKLIFYVEWFGLAIFALYWWIKSNELSEKRAEILAIEKHPALSSEPQAQSSGSPATAATPA